MVAKVEIPKYCICGHEDINHNENGCNIWWNKDSEDKGEITVSSSPYYNIIPPGTVITTNYINGGPSKDYVVTDKVSVSWDAASLPDSSATYTAVPVHCKRFVLDNLDYVRRVHAQNSCK